MTNIQKLNEEILYLESIISDYLDNGFTQLALEKQAEVDKLYGVLHNIERDIRKNRAEREFDRF